MCKSSACQWKVLEAYPWWLDGTLQLTLHAGCSIEERVKCMSKNCNGLTTSSLPLFSSSLGMLLEQTAIDAPEPASNDARQPQWLHANHGFSCCDINGRQMLQLFPESCFELPLFSSNLRRLIYSRPGPSIFTPVMFVGSAIPALTRQYQNATGMMTSSKIKWV